MSAARPLCPYHRTTLRVLTARLGRAHQGHAIARRTLASVARQCPACIKETPA